MSHSLLGMGALNLLFLAVGCCVLWAIRGWKAWPELVRLGGVAYLLGVAVVGVLATDVLIAGLPLGVPVVVGLSVLAAGAGVAVGLALRRPRPSWRLGEPRREPLLLLGMACAALVLVFLEAFFRVAHLQGLFAYDAWAFWTPKAQAIYYFGGLDQSLFTSLAGNTYPIFVPTLQAMDFHFMGSPDTVVLHVQYWFLLIGFVSAVLGFLRPRVPLVLIWPFLLLMVLMPDLDYRVLNPQGDLPLDYFFVAAALCVALWIVRPERWLLVSYAVFLAASLSTKREGQLLAAVLVAAALLSTSRSRRFAWPRLIGVGALAFSFTIPWRLWLDSHHISGEWEEASWSGMLHNLWRIPPALRVVTELLFNYDFWLIAVPLGMAAGLVLLVRRREPLATLYFGMLALGFAGMTWIYWAFTRLPIDMSDQTPVPRVIGALVLSSIAFAPLMLARALGTEADVETREQASG